MNGGDENRIQLAEMIQLLRNELKRAQDLSESEDLQFIMEQVELELQIALESSKSAEGGVKFWVINAGGAFEKSGAITHTFKITMKPFTGDDDGPLKVSKKTEKALSKK